jgi:hypothetical protein
MQSLVIVCRLPDQVNQARECTQGLHCSMKVSIRTSVQKKHRCRDVDCVDIVVLCEMMSIESAEEQQQP